MNAHTMYALNTMVVAHVRFYLPRPLCISFLLNVYIYIYRVSLCMYISASFSVFLCLHVAHVLLVPTSSKSRFILNLAPVDNT